MTTKAYMIITAKLSNREQFLNTYSKVVPGLVDKFGGRYLLLSPGATTLEGDWGDGVSMAVSEWPDREAALAFWNSPEYEEAKKLRAGLGEFQVMLIEADDLAKHFASD